MSQAQIAEEIQVNTALVIPALLADKSRTVYLRIGLTGFPLQTKEKLLVPVNMALVIDTSNSMLGLKIDQAKKMAIMAVERLRSTDLMSIVAFDHQARVLLPTTRVENRKKIVELIQALSGNQQATLFDSTALFDGIEKGATGILKYRQLYQINRMLLFSDGFANVGTHSPSEIGQFGRVLGEQNVTVTTIGFGPDYNKNLMMQLAEQSDGNHAVVEKATEVSHIIKIDIAFFDK